MQLDVTDAQAIDAAVTRVIDTCNRIDVLVNNAGIAGLAALEEMPDAEIDRMMQVNFIAPVRLSRAVLPTMRAQGHGRIIMVSSLSALVGLPGETIYSASKAALEAMAEGLRYEVDRFNISVSVIEPGLFNTAMQDKTVMNAVCPPDSPYAPLLKHLQPGSGIQYRAGRRPVAGRRVAGTYCRRGKSCIPLSRGRAGRDGDGDHQRVLMQKRGNGSSAP